MITIETSKVFFFLTFDMDKQGNIRQPHWKERRKISRSANFDSDTS